jgi:hypothetical protein
MAHRAPTQPPSAGNRVHISSLLSVVVGLLSAAGCAPATQTSGGATAPTPAAMSNAPVCFFEGNQVPCPMTTGSEARVGLRAGRMNATEATWNLRVASKRPPADSFAQSTNSDLAFTGRYAIQGNYNGFQIWDISNPGEPSLVRGYYCPASQSDVSVYKNLLFVSAEGQGGRLDCGGQGVRDSVSKDRIRGIRIFDISDIRNPRYVGNVQTCRGSHTHTVLVDPRDTENVYVYISGSAGVRSPTELSGCVRERPDRNPSSALFRIEVIKVPLARPEQAAIVSSPRIFNDLAPPPRHGEAPEDIEAARRAVEAAKARGAFTAVVFGTEQVLPPFIVNPALDSIVKARGGTGAPTAADSAALRAAAQSIVDRIIGAQGPRTGPTQCHDITVYPAIGLAGGACEGYGMLLDIRDPVNPVRISAVADSNFAYWHSATFNNDGTKILFSDEWGGGGAPKCRSTDRKEWGANALFTIESNRQMVFQSYYKLPAPQTRFENCVAHNGSLIRSRGATSWSRGGTRAVSRSSTGPTRRTRWRSRTTTAAPSTRPAWAVAARGRHTGTTAPSTARRSRAGSTSSS